MLGQRSSYLKLLRILLRPLARFCLTRALTIQDFYSIGRLVFIEVAEEQIRVSTEKVNASRISVLTGIYREDIAKILAEEKSLLGEGQSMMARVLAHWEHDAEFLTRGGEPRVLKCNGPKNEFFTLVERVSRNINPATVLFELERIGAVERGRKGLRIVRRGVSYHADPEKAFDLIARDLESLIAAVETNIIREDPIGNMHVRTEYDNIYVKDLPVIRQWLLDQGRMFHKQAREFISRFDRDMNPLANDKEQAGGRVVVQAFSYCPDPEKRVDAAASNS